MLPDQPVKHIAVRKKLARTTPGPRNGQVGAYRAENDEVKMR
jgi:hypothetical protein